MKKYKFTINGNTYDAEILNVEEQVISLELNGTPYQVTVDKEIKQVKTPKVVVQAAPAATDNIPKTAPASALSIIKSPLPGTVLDINVRVGDSVNVGQKVMLLEAMKMENNIEADKSGVVKEIKVSKGDAVMEGDPLLVIG